MNEEFKISIVTIVYNDANHIETTVRNILFEQEYGAIEYIVIDGGSTDGTLDILQKYADQISIIVSEPDKGISDAFNKGVQLATGDLIGLINSGDYYEPGIISKVVKAYGKYQDCNKFNVIHGDIRMFDKVHSKTYKPFPLKTFAYQMPIWHPTCFVSKDVYRDFSYSLNYRIAMDYELFSRLYKRNANFIYLDQVISHMNTEGISNSNAQKGFKEVYTASIANLGLQTWKASLYFFRRVFLLKLMECKRKLW